MLHSSRVSLIVVAALLLLSLAISTTDAARSRLQSHAAPRRAALSPFDPSAYTVHMPTAERAWRAANTPGGEVSYCCCYCGRSIVPPEDEAEIARNEWLYAPLPRQPRPQRGSITERLMRRQQRGAKHGAKPEPEEGSSGVAEWYMYRTVETRCNNEFCASNSDACLRAHLWTGWAGALTTPGQVAPQSVVRARCEEKYQREMEVLADLARRAAGGG